MICNFRTALSALRNLKRSLGKLFKNRCNISGCSFENCKIFYFVGYARDSTGKWQVIVQTEDLPQRVAIDLCHSPEKPCKKHQQLGNWWPGGRGGGGHKGVVFISA